MVKSETELDIFGEQNITRYKRFYLKKICSSFLWVGFNCLEATKPLWEDSLLFTTIQSSEFLVLILSTWKGWTVESTLKAAQWFWTQGPWIGIPVPYPSGICSISDKGIKDDGRGKKAHLKIVKKSSWKDFWESLEACTSDHLLYMNKSDLRGYRVPSICGRYHWLGCPYDLSDL